MIADGSKLEGADRSMYLQHFDTNVVSVAKVVEVFGSFLSHFGEIYNLFTKIFGYLTGILCIVKTCIRKFCLKRMGRS